MSTSPQDKTRSPDILFPYPRVPLLPCRPSASRPILDNPASLFNPSSVIITIVNTRQAVVTIVSVTAIAVLEICAITHGINGPFLTMAIAAIAGLGGYQIHQARTK